MQVHGGLNIEICCRVQGDNGLDVRERVEMKLHGAGRLYDGGLLRRRHALLGLIVDRTSSSCFS